MGIGDFLGRLFGSGSAPGSGGGGLKLVTAATAAEVCQHWKVPDEAQPLLRPDMSPEQFLKQLMKQKLYLPAVEFLAHGLPKREAVWWACVCLRSVQGSYEQPAFQAQLTAAENWARGPTEENRLAASASVARHGHDTPAAWVASAAGWSGGSFTTPPEPPVPPDEYLTAKSAAGAITLAATQAPKPLKEYPAFLALGIEVANGVSH